MSSFTGALLVFIVLSSEILNAFAYGDEDYPYPVPPRRLIRDPRRRPGYGYHGYRPVYGHGGYGRYSRYRRRHRPRRRYRRRHIPDPGPMESAGIRSFSSLSETDFEKDEKDEKKPKPSYTTPPSSESHSVYGRHDRPGFQESQWWVHPIARSGERQEDRPKYSDDSYRRQYNHKRDTPWVVPIDREREGYRPYEEKNAFWF